MTRRLLPLLFRAISFLLGVCFGVPSAVLLACATFLPITISGIAYLLVSSLLAIGLILIALRLPRARALVWAGAILFFATAWFRLASVRMQAARISLIDLPSGSAARWINSLIDEQDAVIFGEAILHSLGGVSTREHGGITTSLQAAYADAKSAQAAFASPFLSTYFNFEQGGSFDAVVIEPTSTDAPRNGVLFLHGFMGNVAVQCWEIAQAAEAIGAITVCPSTNWMGQWNNPEGGTIIRESLRYLQGRGVKQIVFGGFSNGGVGVETQIRNFRDWTEIKGIFLIAGVRTNADLRGTTLPVLIIQGRNDERMRVLAARQLAASLGERATYAELDGDHFLIVKQPLPVQESLRNWFEWLMNKKNADS